MYVCLSHNARREEAAAYEVLHGSLEMKAGLAGADDRQRGARQIRDGIVVLDCRVLKRAHTGPGTDLPTSIVAAAEFRESCEGSCRLGC
jgi:hypothetical protein